MQTLSAGYECHCCTKVAPTVGKKSRFAFLTEPQRAGFSLQPSCEQHATIKLVKGEYRPVSI